MFLGNLLNIVFSCKSVLPHHPCTQWLKFGFVSEEVWDSALNLRSTSDTQENHLSSVFLGSALEAGTKGSSSSRTKKSCFLAMYNTRLSRCQ